MPQTSHPRKQPRLAPKQAQSFGPLCLAIARLNPTAVDTSVLEELFGKAEVSTLAEVAKLFGVASTTVSSNWRRDGMPGEEKHWKLADIATWLIKRNIKQVDRGSGRASVDEARKQVELEIKQMELAKLQRDEQRELGEMINRHDTMVAMRSVISVAAERIITSVDQMAVILPVDQAVQVVERLRTEVSHALKAVAELTAEELKDADADIVTRFEQVELMLSYERASHKSGSAADARPVRRKRGRGDGGDPGADGGSPETKADDGAGGPSDRGAGRIIGRDQAATTRRRKPSEGEDSPR